jgi:hypothetical protein
MVHGIGGTGEATRSKHGAAEDGSSSVDGIGATIVSDQKADFVELSGYQGRCSFGASDVGTLAKKVGYGGAAKPPPCCRWVERLESSR